MRRAVILVRIDDEHGTCGTLSTIMDLPTAGELDTDPKPRSDDTALRDAVDDALSRYPNLATWTVTR